MRKKKSQVPIAIEHWKKNKFMKICYLRTLHILETLVHPMLQGENERYLKLNWSLKINQNVNASI